MCQKASPSPGMGRMFTQTTRGSKVQEEDPTPLCGKTSYSNISKTERVSSLLRLFFPSRRTERNSKDRRDSECDPGAGPGSVPSWLYTLTAPKLFSLNWDITLVHLYGIQYHDLICIYNVWWSNRTISISMSSNINNFCMLQLPCSSSHFEMHHRLLQPIVTLLCY